MANTDVDVQFGADFGPAEQQTHQYLAELQRTAAQIRNIGLAAFGTWALNTTFDLARSGLSTLVGEAKEWIAAASEAEDVDKRLDIAVAHAGSSFKFTADQLREMATQLEHHSTFSDESIKQAQQSLIQFKLTGDQFQRTQQLAVDMASALGEDVTQAAQTLGHSLVNPERGLMLLRRSGIELTEQQRQMVKQFIETGNVAGAQNIIIEALEGRYRDAGEEMAHTANGGFKQLLEIVGDIKEELGGAFLEVFRQVQPVLRELGIAVQDWAHKLNESLKETATKWGPTLRDLLVEAFAAIEVALEASSIKLEQWLATWDKLVSTLNLVGDLPHMMSDLASGLITGKPPKVSEYETAQREANERKAAADARAAAFNPLTAFASALSDWRELLKNGLGPVGPGGGAAGGGGGGGEGDDGFGGKKFTSGFEDAATAFKRIQAARFGDSAEQTAKQHLGVAQQQLGVQQQIKQNGDEQKRKLDEISEGMNQPAKAG